MTITKTGLPLPDETLQLALRTAESMLDAWTATSWIKAEDREKHRPVALASAACMLTMTITADRSPPSSPEALMQRLTEQTDIRVEMGE